MVAAECAVYYSNAHRTYFYEHINPFNGVVYNIIYSVILPVKVHLVVW